MLRDSRQGEEALTDLSQGWKRARRDGYAMLEMTGLLLLLFLAIFGHFIAPFLRFQPLYGPQMLPPSWHPDGEARFFLGTDALGSDILSQLICGIAPTFGSAIVITLFSTFTGVLVGVLLAQLNKRYSSIISFLLEILTLPHCAFMAVILLLLFGPGLDHAILALGLAMLPDSVCAAYRAARMERGKEYLVPFRLDGVPLKVLLFSIIIPNLTPALIVVVTRQFSTALLTIATLGFLNLGAQPPTTEWGVLIGQSDWLVKTLPWLVIWPGFALLATLLVVNSLGERLRQAFEAEY